MSQYPIRTIAELTGVPATTLRAWERRYGLLKPSRTAKGHRLYSADDIDLVNEIIGLLNNDYSISEAVRIIRDPEQHATVNARRDAHWDSYQHRMLKAIENFDEQKLDRVYNEVLALYPIDMVTEHVILPLMGSLGERWQQRAAGIAEEHFFSAYLRNKVGARLHHEAQRSGGSRILVCCLPGEHHELGLLLFCLAAIGHGYRILYLGTDMPLEQLAAVVDDTDVAAVLLSGTAAAQDDIIRSDAFADCVATIQVPVMLGGLSADRQQQLVERAGAHAIGSEHIRALQTMEKIIPAFGRK